MMENVINSVNKKMVADILKEVDRMFDILNEKYFNNELSVPQFTTVPNDRAYGWFIMEKIWLDHGTNTRQYEIGISATHLYRDPVIIIETLLHEMCHLYSSEKNIKDVSRGNYHHNKNYRDIALNHGLNCIYVNSNYGWTGTTLTEESRLFIESQIDKSVFALTRGIHKNPLENEDGDESENGDLPAKGKKKSSTRIYICPMCGTKIRATKDVNVICGDCYIPFELLDDDNSSDEQKNAA